MSIDQSLEPVRPAHLNSPSKAAFDLRLPGNLQLVGWAVGITGLAAVVVWPPGQQLMAMILRIAWLYVVTGSRG